MFSLATRRNPELPGSGLLAVSAVGAACVDAGAKPAEHIYRIDGKRQVVVAGTGARGHSVTPTGRVIAVVVR